MSTVDFAYLESYLGGDRAVAAEVLELFRGQGRVWVDQLNADNPEWRAVAHTIKGAARGVGANALGEACDAAEFGSTAELPAAHAALLQALDEVDAYLAR